MRRRGRNDRVDIGLAVVQSPHSAVTSTVAPTRDRWRFSFSAATRSIPVGRGPGALLDLELSPLDMELVAPGVDLVELGEQAPAHVVRPDHRHRARDDGKQEDGGDDRGPHHRLRSATRSTALRARGFVATSRSDGRRGGLERDERAAGTGRLDDRQAGVGGAEATPSPRMKRLTMRSSREWKLSTTSRPPGTSRSGVAASPRRSSPSSSLTCTRIAWNVRVAGCTRARTPPPRTAPATMAASRRVVATGMPRLRSATTARAMRRAARSSPRFAQHSPDLLLGSAREPLGRGYACARIHSHVQRTVVQEAESTLRLIELGGGDPEVHQHRVDTPGKTGRPDDVSRPRRNERDVPKSVNRGGRARERPRPPADPDPLPVRGPPGPPIRSSTARVCPPRPNVQST